MSRFRVKISTGQLPSPVLQHWAALHPFIQQIDVLFPSSDEIERCFSALNVPRYAKARAQLSDIVSHSDAFISQSALERCEADISVLNPKLWCDGDAGCPECVGQLTWAILGLDPSSDEDAWCIDPRGLLTVAVCKETYQALGLVGQKLPFKGSPERHVIRLPLQKHAESVTNRTRRDSALKAWDDRRGRPWNIVFYRTTSDVDHSPDFLEDIQICNVEIGTRKMWDIHVPIPQLSHRPDSVAVQKHRDSKTAEELEDGLQDWDADMMALFEWIGMACLGSQRLQANDRVDPYVAVYESPTPSRVGDVTHMRWTGLISPLFIQQLLDTAMNLSSSPNTNDSFIALTAHAITSSPVSYIPSSSLASRNRASTRDTPPADDTYGGAYGTLQATAKFPKADGEDSWSLLVTLSRSLDDSSTEKCDWAMVESLGEWDARWG